MRVGIISIQQESNTFSSSPTTLDDFKADALLTGEAIREMYADSRHEVGGFFVGLAEADIEAIPLVLALATPGGVVQHKTLVRLMEMMFEQLEQAGELDGLLVAPHGAAVSEQHRDMDGYWLTALRDRVGPKMWVVCTLDAHANISKRMVDACNATLVYRTNPHLDQHEIGLEASRLITRSLRGEIQPVQAIASPPVAISIDRQDTAALPCTDLYALADAMLGRVGILSNSVSLGFPYADVEEMGSSFVVVADQDRSLAQRSADELAQYLTDHRQVFGCQLIDVDQALRQAAAGSQRTCLLDMGDNVGGGSPGDGTTLAHAMHVARLDSAFVCLYDPAAALQAREAGSGAVLTLSMGGKTDNLHGPPLVAEVMVGSMHDGRFAISSPTHGGRTGYDMGSSVVVKTRHGLTIMLISSRIPPFALEQLSCCGLDPRSFKLLVAKGVNAPIAAYRLVCEQFIRVNTPGLTCADMTSMTYQHRRRPLFPFEPISIEDPSII